jgi:hypothetical protein
MNDRKIMSKAEFRRLLNDPKVQKRAPGGSKADWEAIYEALVETNEPLEIRTIFEEYVKGAVTRYRTNKKLQEWAIQGRCKQIWYLGRYWFFFGDRDDDDVQTSLESIDEDELE